jgi:3-hydroxyacyl-CoA dehydrogenase
MTIGIIGSGAMGAGIAQVVATAGHEVRLLDQNAAALEKATTGIAASLRRLAEVLPDGVTATILADRGFADTKLFEFLTELGFG